MANFPPRSPPTPDGREVSEAAWFEPRAALEAHAADEMALVFPTIRNLESLLRFDRSEDVIEAARGRSVEQILPIVVGTREEHDVLLPGDPGYDEAATT